MEFEFYLFSRVASLFSAFLQIKQDNKNKKLGHTKVQNFTSKKSLIFIYHLVL